jgi:hypothetical protein
MSGHSAKAKTSARSIKTVRRNTKKTSKSARPGTKITKTRGHTGRKQSSSPTRLSVTRADVSSRVKRATLSPHTIAPIVAPASSSPDQTARPMSLESAHKYQVGETVYYTSPSFGRTAASGTYTIVKLLPSERDDYQYRIKSTGEAFERVAKESQLDKA